MAEPFAPDPYRLAGLQGRNLTFYDFGRRDEKRAILAGLRAIAARPTTPRETSVVVLIIAGLINDDRLLAGTETSDSAPEAPASSE